MMISSTLIFQKREQFHSELLKGGLTIDQQGIPAIADKGNKLSIQIARNLVEELGSSIQAARLAGQTSGRKFEQASVRFLSETFPKLNHLRPGKWKIHTLSQRDKLGLAQFQQFTHLQDLHDLCQANRKLASAVGYDYIISPDIVIIREPIKDEHINQTDLLVDTNIARRTGLRSINSKIPILHASISCKWTIRSDRAQNARSEALNLIRNRKGHAPHITVLTAEPLPSRLASLTLGTGDLDCVYHFALPELIKSIEATKSPDALDLIELMVEGNRLRDIADLVFDLAV